MTIEPAFVVAAFAAVGSGAAYLFKMFMSGDIHPKSTVLRSDYDAVLAINATLATKDAEKTEVLKGMAEALKGVAKTIENVVPKNGVK